MGCFHCDAATRARQAFTRIRDALFEREYPAAGARPTVYTGLQDMEVTKASFWGVSCRVVAPFKFLSYTPHVVSIY